MHNIVFSMILTTLRPRLFPEDLARLHAVIKDELIALESSQTLDAVQACFYSDLFHMSEKRGWDEVASPICYEINQKALEMKNIYITDHVL